MAWVKLQQDWFAPGCLLIRKDEYGHPVEIPENLIDYLPNTAVIVDGAGVPIPKKAERLADYDEARSVAEAFDHVALQADKQRERIAAARAAETIVEAVTEPPPDPVSEPDTSQRRGGPKAPRSGG